MNFSLTIDENSSVPKYIQVIKSIKSLILAGNLKYGEKIPSINNLSAEYYLSRDTVEKAYQVLKKQGIIESVRGKGFYICHDSDLSKFKILLLFNKLSTYKKEIYNALITKLEDRAEISFHVYHCEYPLFKRILDQQKEHFDFYVIMPHFKKEMEAKAMEELLLLPPEKLLFLDRIQHGIPNFFGAVYQDFKQDIYQALTSLENKFRKYQKVTLVFPAESNYPYPEPILHGFKSFVVEKGMDFQIISQLNEDLKLSPNEAFIVIEESDLVKLIKKVRNSPGLKVGKNFGILSYNETPLKEVLQKGITVISTDFQKMGKLTAEMILSKEGKKIKNDFQVIVRNSL